MQINLADIFNSTWGYQPDAFDPKFATVNGVSSGLRKEVGSIYGSPYYTKDVRGRELFMPLEVQVGFDQVPGQQTTYAEKFGVRDASGAYTGRWVLPYTVISVTEVSQNIVDTPLTERNGMVSELINIGAYKMNVKGILINHKNEFPEEDFIALNKLMNLGCVGQVNNPLTDVILSFNGGDKTVTLRNLRFYKKAGVKHTLPYELDMIVDAPFDIEEI